MSALVVATVAPVPTERRQLPWLIPTFIVLVVGGLGLVILGIATQAWVIIVVGALGILGNGLGLWAQLGSRRSQAGRED